MEKYKDLMKYEIWNEEATNETKQWMKEWRDSHEWDHAVEIESWKQDIDKWTEKSWVERKRQRRERLKKRREREEQERIKKERKEQEKIKREREEQERIKKERKEQEKIKREREEQERIKKEREEQEKIKREREEQEKIKRERGWIMESFYAKQVHSRRKREDPFSIESVVIDLDGEAQFIPEVKNSEESWLSKKDEALTKRMENSYWRKRNKRNGKR